MWTPESFHFQQYLANLPIVYLILINPLAFCRDLINFNFHQIHKLSQNNLHDFTKKHRNLAKYIFNTELHFCVYLEIFQVAANLI